jgi:hypothetical protein
MAEMERSAKESLRFYATEFVEFVRGAPRPATSFSFV